jgi:hypothetical protein
VVEASALSDFRGSGVGCLPLSRGIYPAAILPAQYQTIGFVDSEQSEFGRWAGMHDGLDAK